MKNIAYFSPLPFLKSGIADYSYDLVGHLRKHVNIDLFVSKKQMAQIDKNIIRDFSVHKIDDFELINKQKQFDATMYHIGNNADYHGEIYKKAIEHPGIVVLHDFAIHHLIAALTFAQGKNSEYICEMEYNYGDLGRNLAMKFIKEKTAPLWGGEGALKFPLNKRLIDSAKGFVVHSTYARQGIKKINKDVPVKVIPLLTPEITQDMEFDKKAARQNLGIDNDVIILASFGFINSSKRIHKVLSAIARMKAPIKKKIKYYLVGEQNEPEYPLDKIIAELNLSDVVEFKGFLQLDAYTDFMKATDICINLRFPYHGESSGNLHRMFGYGKVALISDVGAFSEYPSDFVMKIGMENEEEDIYHALMKLFEQPDLLAKMSHNAWNYAKHYCSLGHVANEYAEFINKVSTDYFVSEGLIELVAEVVSQAGIEEDESLLREISRSLISLI